MEVSVVLVRPREKMRLASAHWLASRERGLRFKPLKREYTVFCKKQLPTPRYTVSMILYHSKENLKSLDISSLQSFLGYASSFS